VAKVTRTGCVMRRMIGGAGRDNPSATLRVSRNGLEEMSQPAPLLVRGRRLEWGARTYVMSIINVTPDSFAGTGPGTDPAAVLARARDDLAAGADLLDVGGESTRPGAESVDAATELRRVMPAIELLAAETDALISVDTTKHEVAEAALRGGAAIVNDVSGLHGDERMAAVVACHKAPVILMANLRGRRFAHVIAAVRRRLRSSIEIAQRHGIAFERLILDPGFGFGPSAAQNLEIVRRLRRVRALGRPVLIGPSRKSTIGRVLGLPVEERVEGTAATVALAIAGGADIVRVHDTRVMVRVARMADAIVRGWKDSPQAPAGTSA
jgi:dihydropteroate synthase